MTTTRAAADKVETRAATRASGFARRCRCTARSMYYRAEKMALRTRFDRSALSLFGLVAVVLAETNAIPRTLAATSELESP